MAVANGLLMAILALVLCCRSVWADQPDGDGVRTDMVVPVSRWNTASKKGEVQSNSINSKRIIDSVQCSILAFRTNFLKLEMKVEK